ncbi:MAG: BlaI/MecI/CopY family transcriptional regulator [Pseudomonadota bacterium]
MRISDAESVVMEALWASHPRSAQDIIDEVAGPNDWSAVTVRSLLSRLMNKGAVSAVRDGRKYLYSPLVARDEYVHEASQNLIDRLFDGQLAPLVSHLSERQALSTDDIRALKQLIRTLPGGDQDD